MQLTHQKFFTTSLPFILASISVPLIGAVDTAVVGRLGNYHFINSVALGSVIFSTIFWLFNFLGLTASGFASQSLGRNDPEEELYAFLRGTLLATGIGLVIVILQKFIFDAAVYFFNPPQQTLLYMRQYFNIIIFTVPCALFYQTAQGWLALCRLSCPSLSGLLPTSPMWCWLLSWSTASALALQVLPPLLPLPTYWRACLLCTAFLNISPAPCG